MTSKRAGAASAGKGRPKPKTELVDVPIGEFTGANIRTPSKDGLAELTASVKASGILLPVLAVRENGGYRLVDGFRRVEAAKRAGLRTVRTLVAPSHGRPEQLEADVRATALVTNLQREGMSGIEEGRAYRSLVDAGVTQSQIAELVGKSAPYVSSRLKLLELNPKVLDELAAGKISDSHAEVIARAPAQIQKSLSRDVQLNDWSVHRLEERAQWKTRTYHESVKERARLIQSVKRSKNATCPYPEGGKPCGKSPTKFDYGSSDFVYHGAMGEHVWSLKTGKLRYPPREPRTEDQASGEVSRPARQEPTLPEVTPHLPFAASPGDLLDMITAGSPKVDGIFLGHRKGRTDVFVKLQLPRELVPNVPWFVVGDLDGGERAEAMSEGATTTPGQAFMGGCNSWDQQTDPTRKNLAETKAALQAWGEKVAGGPRGKSAVPK